MEDALHIDCSSFRKVGNSRFDGVSCLNLGIKYALNDLMVLQPLKELLGFDGRTR